MSSGKATLTIGFNYSLWAVTSLEIYCLLDGLQVFGIHAAANATKMIYHQSFRDWPNVKLIAVSMGIPLVELSIPIGISASSP